MSSCGGHQYAFVIQTRDSGHPHWSWITAFGSTDCLVIGRGVVDDAVGSPRVFGRATFRAYLDKLVAQVPAAVDYYLFDDDHGTDWRILVWDVPATGYDQRSTVPPPDNSIRAGYALALAIEGGEPHYVGTWNGVDVRKRLHDLVMRAEASRTGPRGGMERSVASARAGNYTLVCAWPRL